MATTGSFLSGNYSGTSTSRQYYSKSISEINTLINNTVPSNAVITTVKVNVNVSFSFSGLGTCKANYTYGFGGNGSISTALLGNTDIHSGTFGDKSNSKSHTSDIKSRMSSLSHPFALSTAYGSYFTVGVQSDNIQSKKLNVDSVTLTLEWTIPVYKVSVSAGTGCATVNIDGWTTSTDVYAGTTVTLYAAGATGYKWGSWSNGSTAEHYTITVNSDINLTANYVPITYYVCYDKNGGTGTMNSDLVNYGATYTIANCTFTAPTITVTYNANGGSCSKTSETKSKGFVEWQDDYTLKSYGQGQQVSNLYSQDGDVCNLLAIWSEGVIFTTPTPTRSGYTFQHWLLESENKTYGANTNNVITKSITLKAIWKSNKIENAYSGSIRNAVYVGGIECQVYVGNTKVYG